MVLLVLLLVHCVVLLVYHIVGASLSRYAIGLSCCWCWLVMLLVVLLVHHVASHVVGPLHCS